MKKPANTRVETKILVLHFLHSGGGTTNLVLHENNTLLIYQMYLTSTFLDFQMIYCSNIFDFNFRERENIQKKDATVLNFVFLLLAKN